MSVIVKHIPHTVDLNEPIKKVYIDTLMATGNNMAHCFDIALVKEGQAVTMPSGAAVTAYLIRYGDNATVPITNGTVSGNVVSVTLAKACYNKAGQVAIIINVTADGVTNTVFYGEGTIFTGSTDTVVNDENIVPTLADLLAQIAAMEAGTAAANTATNRANAAANRCEQMQIDASGMAGDSNKLGGKDASEYLTSDKVVNNFTTTEAGFVADARTVAVLNEKFVAEEIRQQITLEITSSTTGRIEYYDYNIAKSGYTPVMVSLGAMAHTDKVICVAALVNRETARLYLYGTGRTGTISNNVYGVKVLYMKD